MNDIKRVLKHGIETCTLAIRKYKMDETRALSVGRADLAQQARESRQAMINMRDMFIQELNTDAFIHIQAE